MVADIRSITKKYLADGIHSTDVGYKIVADIWFAGIKAAHARGWIQRPIGPDPLTSVSNTKAKAQTAITKKRRCRKEPQLSAVNKGQYLTGGLGHKGQAKFFPKRLSQGQVSKGRNLNVAGIHFTDLNGDGTHP